MTTIIFLITFYWMFSSIITLSVGLEKKIPVYHCIWISFLLGWCIFPILIGKKL